MTTLEELLRMRDAEIRELRMEIGVLTLERDNALLRIEELERQRDFALQAAEYGRPSTGGVHPNA